MHLGAGLRVTVVDAQQHIGEGVGGVGRVGSAVGEVDVALDVVLRVARVRSALVIEAELEGMLPADFRQIVNEVVDDESLVEGPEYGSRGQRAGARQSAQRDGWDQV